MSDMWGMSTMCHLVYINVFVFVVLTVLFNGYIITHPATLPISLPPPPSLSLSHTHTHTHAHLQHSHTVISNSVRLKCQLVTHFKINTAAY